MKAIIFFPITMVLVIYFIIGHIVPTYKEGAAYKAEKETKEMELTAVNDDLARINSFGDEVDMHPEEVQFVQNFVPQDPSEQEIINAVSRFAQKHETELFTVSFASTRETRVAKDNPAQYFEGTVIATGPYEKLMAFTHDLFRVNRLYAFNEYSLNKIEIEERLDDTGTPIEQDPNALTLTANFYYGYLGATPRVSPSDFVAPLEYSVIQDMQNTIENAEPIGGEVIQRGNPFLP